MSADPPRTDREALGYLARLAGYGALARVAAFMALSAATEGFGLLLLVPLVHVVAGGGASGPAAAWLGPVADLPLGVLLAAFVTLTALRALVMFVVHRERTDLHLALVRKLQTQVQRAVVGAEWRWLSSRRGADFGAMIVGEAHRIGALVEQAMTMATGLITITALLGFALWLAWPITLLTVALGATIAFVYRQVRRDREQSGERYSDAYRRLTRHMAEGLSHLRATRIAGAEAAMLAEFDAATGELALAQRDYHRVVQRGRLGLQVIAAAMLAVLVWSGLGFLAIPLAVFVPVLAIFLRIVPMIGAIQEGLRAWGFCRPALADLMQTVDEARAAAEPLVAEGASPRLGRAIVLDDVRLHYAGRTQPVFEGLSCTVPAGAVVGVSGPSGSGKSTLADLVAGLLVPDGGTITVDGEPLVGAQRIRWRRQVAYVEQTPHLIDGTIAENLGWGIASPDRAAMERALEGASATFVFDLPAGLDTVVGEKGRELSGGERQRIAFARALMREPSLIILDEVTAALDQRNEAAIAETIERLRGSCTFLVLGHRPALYALADHRIDLSARD